MSTETQLYAPRQPLPPVKFSRYRSVRQANGISATSPPTLPFCIATARHDVSIGRSPSRYHRKAKSADTAAGTLGDQRVRAAAPLHSHSASLATLTGESYPVPNLQDTYHNSVKTIYNNNAATSISAQKKSISRPVHRPNPSPAAPDQIPQTSLSYVVADPSMSQIATSENEKNDEACERLRAEAQRLRRIKAKQNAAREFERSKMMASAEKTQSGRLENKERDALKSDASTSQGTDLTLTRKRGDLTLGPTLEEAQNVSPNNVWNAAKSEAKVHELRSGQRHTLATVEALSTSVENLSHTRKLARPTQTRPARPEKQLLLPADIQPSITSLSPLRNPELDPVASDIPRSAVNAGERRVTVKYNKSVISLPVTPTTNSQDLLNSASTISSNRFDPQQSVLSESFTQLGLERPLRKYEHVRNVMNSWDYDTQNHLVVMTTSANVLSKGDVDPRTLPKQPNGTLLYMYYSQKPGKWDKRWVSLNEDGQISISKGQDGSESSILCHLSDFDIYKLTQRQMKKVRPPKKACFAIKSQQKSVMFLNGANFVHFFATNEGPLTETWYNAVRTWRSWYLVNALGEGQEQGNDQISGAGGSAGLRTMAPETGGQDQQPLSSKREQQSGSRLIKTSSPTKSVPKAQSSKAMKSRDLREVSLRGRSAPPSSFPSYHTNQFDQSVPTPGSKRAPSLVKGGERNASMRSGFEAPSSLRRSTSLSRAGSIRQSPKPLVDLTPQFQEQPQHLRKGRGVTPIPGKLLVELATDVEAMPGAINIPSVRVLQRPKDTGLGGTASIATAVKSARGLAEPLGDNLAFTGTGLLSRSMSKRTQGGIGHGYGLKTGDRNHVSEPLVDLRIESQFTDGSLLRRVEKFRGEDERGLIVDRVKRIEKDIRVGEGE